jgi:hypothetical protein
MTTTYRRRRGAQTQAWLARFLREEGFPHATDAGAGRQGTDILGTDRITWEAKSRREMSPTLGRAQSDSHGGEQTPVVIRPDGYGEARIADWPVCVPLGQYVHLLRMAGYGEPLSRDAAPGVNPWTGKPRSSPHGDPGHQHGALPTDPDLPRAEVAEVAVP